MLDNVNQFLSIRLSCVHIRESLFLPQIIHLNGLCFIKLNIKYVHSKVNKELWDTTAGDGCQEYETLMK